MSEDVVRAATVGDLKVLERWLRRERHPDIHHVSLIMQEAAKNGHDNVCQLMIDSEQTTKSLLSYALIIACTYGHLSTAMFLMQQGLASAEELVKALLNAVVNGHKQIVKWLINDVVKLPAKDCIKWSFILACSNGDIEEVKQLAAQLDNDVTVIMSHALRVACCRGRHEVVNWLTSCYITADVTRVIGMQTALMVACNNGHMSIVTELLHCVTPRSVNMISGIMRDTALHFTICNEPTSNIRLHRACNDGNIEKICLYQSNIDLQNRHGFTPLHYACRNGHVNEVQTLLSLFADAELTDSDGLTPAMIANKFHHEKLKEYFVKYCIAEVGLKSNPEALLDDTEEEKMLKPDTLTRSVFTSLYVNELASSFYCGQLEGGSCLLHEATENGRPDNAQNEYRHNISDVNEVVRATSVDDTKNEMATAVDKYGIMRAVITGNVMLVKNWLNDHKHINVKHVALAMREAARNGHDDICQLMIDSGQVSHNIIGYAFPVACSHGHLSTAKLLLRQGLVNHKILAEALSSAALYGRRQIVTWLAISVMNLSSNNYIKNQLITACANGDIINIKHLSAHVDWDSAKNQALRVACHNGEHDVIEWLTSHTTADVSNAGVVRPLDGRVTSLMAACDSGYTRIAIQLLQCVSPDTVNITSEIFHETALHFTIWSEHSTLLHHACNDGDVNAVSNFLFYYGCNVQDRYGCTPLHYACQNGHLEIIKLLLSVFADYSATDSEGLTPIMTADKYEQAETVELFLKFCILGLRNLGFEDDSEIGLFDVVKKNLTPDEYGLNFYSSLHLSETFADACYCGQWDMVYWILDYTSIDCNVSVNGDNTALHIVIWSSIWPDYGQTPLHEACIEGNVEEVYRLVKGDINVQDNDGNTPLHLACNRGYSEIVEMLVLEGADLTITNYLNLTPAQVATDQQHGELLGFLDKKNCLFHSTLTTHVSKFAKVVKYSKLLQDTIFSRVELSTGRTQTSFKNLFSTLQLLNTLIVPAKRVSRRVNVRSTKQFAFRDISLTFSTEKFQLDQVNLLSKLRQYGCFQQSDFTKKYFANKTRRSNVPSSTIFRPQYKVQVCPARLFAEETICPVREISPATSRKQNYSPTKYFAEKVLRRLAFDR
jgi:ankyrin repeat protein